MQGLAVRRGAMLLGALVLALLNPVPPQPAADERAECLKQCAGAPKDATGQQLLQCLRSCDPAPASADAGVR